MRFKVEIGKTTFIVVAPNRKLAEKTVRGVCLKIRKLTFKERLFRNINYAKISS